MRLKLLNPNAISQYGFQKPPIHIKGIVYKKKPFAVTLSGIIAQFCFSDGAKFGKVCKSDTKSILVEDGAELIAFGCLYHSDNDIGTGKIGNRVNAILLKE